MLIPLLEKLLYIVFLAALVGWMTLPSESRREPIDDDVMQPLRNRRKWAATRPPTRRGRPGGRDVP